MRKIFVFIMLSVCLAIHAQRVDKPGEPYEVYCSLRLVDNNRCLIAISEEKQMYIVNQNEEIVRFETPAAILSYMSKRGWVFVSHIEFLYWPLCLVMKKTVTSDEQAMEHLYISDNPQKAKKEKAK